MNKFLPTTKDSRGFSLIELLVVVSIIVILSVIGITIFQGQQKNARDARRRADIGAIAEAMEAQRVAGATAYRALDPTFFSSGAVPLDPASTNVAPDNACPGVCKYCVKAATGTCAVNDTTVGALAPGAVTTWTICANLETGGSFCRSNSQ